MNYTPLDIQRRSFQVRFRGFDRHEVREFLSELADELGQLRLQNEKLSEDLQRYSQLLAEHHDREQILKNTLMAAQQTSEEIKANAKKQSQLLLKEAELTADRLVEAAQARANAIERDILELKMQKRQVQNSVLSAIASLRNLMTLMEEADNEQDKVSFLKRRGSSPADAKS